MTGIQKDSQENAKPEPRVPELTQANERDFFTRNEFKPGDYFTYSNAFLCRTVEELAAKHGVTVDYCNPRTSGYNQHGPQTFIVIGNAPRS